MSAKWGCGHLVQRRPFHQLKWGGIYAYLLHVDWFVKLFLFPGFDLHQPTTRHTDGLVADKVSNYRLDWLDASLFAQLKVYSTSSGDMVSVNGGVVVSWGKRRKERDVGLTDRQPVCPSASTATQIMTCQVGYTCATNTPPSTLARLAHAAMLDWCPCLSCHCQLSLRCMIHWSFELLASSDECVRLILVPEFQSGLTKMWRRRVFERSSWQTAACACLRTRMATNVRGEESDIWWGHLSLFAEEIACYLSLCGWWSAPGGWAMWWVHYVLPAQERWSRDSTQSVTLVILEI